MKTEIKVVLRTENRFVLLEARALAKTKTGLFRAPHHSVSECGMVSEIALAAGGILFLDEAEEFRKTVLRAAFRLIQMMPPDLRPTVIPVCSTEEGAARVQGVIDDMSKVEQAKNARWLES